MYKYDKNKIVSSDDVKKILLGNQYYSESIGEDMTEDISVINYGRTRDKKIGKYRVQIEFPDFKKARVYVILNNDEIYSTSYAYAGGLGEKKEDVVKWYNTIKKTQDVERILKEEKDLNEAEARERASWKETEEKQKRKTKKKYMCSKHNSYHYTDSKIGQAHRKYAIGLIKDVITEDTKENHYKNKVINNKVKK